MFRTSSTPGAGETLTGVAILVVTLVCGVLGPFLIG
jgi:hypothetical protein